MKLSTLKVDSSKIETGIEIDKIPQMEGVTLTARGAENKDWRDLRAKLIAEVNPADVLKNGNIRPSILDMILTECLIQAGIVGWSGIEDDEGKPVKFSQKQLRVILENPDYADFRGACYYACVEVNNRARAVGEADAKN